MLEIYKIDVKTILADTQNVFPTKKINFIFSIWTYNYILSFKFIAFFFVILKYTEAPTNKGNSRNSGRGGTSRSSGGSKRSVYVCNIPYDCTSHNLKSIFRKGDYILYV